jgi:hypothetical protein
VNLHSEIDDLRQRVERLEARSSQKSLRGHCSQRRAAEYLGCSREHLRILHLRGEGPNRNADGTYSYDNLDLYKQNAAAG